MGLTPNDAHYRACAG